MPPHPSGDRRRHAGIVEVELGLVDRGDRCVARRLGDIHLGDTLVIGLLGGVIVLAQLGGAVELGLGKLELSLGLKLLGLGALERELERPRLDDEQEIAFLHQLAVDEVDGFEIAAHPRAHLDRLTRFELAGEVAPFLHIPGQRLSHRDGRRRRRCLCRLVSFPEAPIMIEKRGGRTHREKQKDAFYGSPATRRRGHGSCRRLGLARRRIAGLQVRSRLRCIFFGFAIAGLIVPVTTSVAVTVSLFHPRRIRYRRA